MTTTIEAIEHLEQTRRTALVAGDFETVEGLLSDELVFVHPTGKVDTKSSYLATVRHRNPYTALNVVELTAVVRGDVAVVTGETQVIARRDPPKAHEPMNFRYITVWAREGEAWRVIRYQATFA